MKTTKLVSLAIPILLLVGCGVGEKDSIPKTEETSKAMLKTGTSEKQYPYYICEQLVEFQFKKDELLLKLGEAPKDNKKYKDVFKTANDMDEALDRMENIRVLDKYKDIHKLVTFALPIMLMAGWTLNTYGLTHLEFQKVNKAY